jgi:hypothetical protein
MSATLINCYGTLYLINMTRFGHDISAKDALEAFLSPWGEAIPMDHYAHDEQEKVEGDRCYN